MAPAPLLVRTARCLWQWQWQQLMEGLGPADAQGNYLRPSAVFGEPPPLPAAADQADAHVLIVGRSCPWAHRAWLVWSLRRLQSSMTLLVVDPDPEAGRWRFSSPFEGCETLAALYHRCRAPASARATVPVLYSRRENRIVVNESARLIELLNRWPGGDLDLEPPTQVESTSRWRQRLQHAVNDGVYRCGFARNQDAYNRAETALFETLAALDADLRLRSGEWLSGPALSLADVVLFPTLIRLELVYAPLFGCSRLPLWQLPELWNWRSRFYGLKEVPSTCWPDAWRRDYFGALFPLHPSGIIPAGPPLVTLVQGKPDQP